MPTYTVIVNDEQLLALEYETERLARLPRPVPEGSTPLPPLTAAEVVQEVVRQYLAMLEPQALGLVAPLHAMLAQIAPEAREALISRVEQPSVQAYLRVLERRRA